MLLMIRFFIFSFRNEPLKFARTDDVRSFSNEKRAHRLIVNERINARDGMHRKLFRNDARWHVANGFSDRANMFRRRTATAADDI